MKKNYKKKIKVLKNQNKNYYNKISLMTNIRKKLKINQ